MQRDVHNNDLGQPIGSQLPNWRPPAVPFCDLIVGRFCRLERLNPQVHAADLYAANALDVGGRMWTYLPYGPLQSAKAYRVWAEEVSFRTDPFFYAIIDDTTLRAVGVASYLRIDPPSGSIEVGHIAYSPLLQRRVAATEAMFLLMEQAFKFGYRRYEWKCDSLNEPSRAAAKRLGFSLEGIFRQASVVKGRNRDTAWFSVIDRDWPRLRESFLRWLDPANFNKDGMQRVRLAALTSNIMDKKNG